MEHTGPGMPEGIEELSRQASALRDALERSEENTQSMVAAIGSFDLRVSAIEASIRPVQVRTQAITMAHENIDRTIENAEAILAQFDIVRRAEAVILRGPREKLGTFLEAVDLLKGVVHFFSSNKNFKCCEGVLNQVDSLLTNSALKIEEEFRQLMDTYSKPIEPDRLFNCLPKHQLASKGDSEAVGEQPSKSFETALKYQKKKKSFETAIYRNPTIIPSGILLLLHDIARQLVQDGNQQSCYRIYRDARGSALELSLRKLGIEKLSKGDIQRMQWAALKVDIGNWTHLMQIAVKVLLPGERKNCDQIFDGITFNKDQCFVELAGSSVMTLLSFGDTIAKSKRSHGNLFVLLEMYGVMHELQSEVEVVFQGKFCSEMRDAALNLTKSLAQAAQETLVDFEEAVEKDSSKTIMQNGAVHPFTIEVINYVKPLFDYQSTLKILFQQSETSGGAESYLAGVIVKIMQALQNNLNGKSKQYKDPALSHIFLMNNLHCMVMSVRRSQSKDILGGDWIQRHRKIVQQNANQYKRVAWARPEVADTHVWRFSSNGQYSASSAYENLLQGKVVFRSWARIWKAWAPGKCKFFLWLVVHNRCWTADRLARRGLPHPVCCPHCDQEEETINHLLLTCVFAREFWFKLLQTVGQQALPSVVVLLLLKLLFPTNHQRRPQFSDYSGRMDLMEPLK